jgi:uncharacterized iron-regulated protein
MIYRTIHLLKSYDPRMSNFGHFLTLLAIWLTLSSCSQAGVAGGLRLYDLSADKEITLFEALPEIKKSRIVLVGEQHDRENHHRVQLEVIEALHADGEPLAIGLEMFQAESQRALDDWVSGKMSVKDFERVYFENWNLPWRLYGGIFEYARKVKIPMVGLNVSRAITQQVAKGGFESLSPEQKAKLPFVECRVDREYMEFIRQAYGAHAHGHFSFANFCEAQLVWDKAMALSALAHLKTNEGKRMVILAGIGHAWKKGIPDQLGSRSSMSFQVLLPQVPGSIEKGLIGLADADYIMLGLSP